MTRQQQRITIAHRDGARFEFFGDNYRLITTAMGIRMVVDEADTCVWTEPSIQAGGPAEVNIQNSRPDYSSSLIPEVAVGMATATTPPPLMVDRP